METKICSKCNEEKLNCNFNIDNSIEGIIYDMVNKKKQNIGTVMGDDLEDKGDFIANIMNKINNV